MKKLITYLLMLPLLLVSCQENGIDSVPAQENSASKSTELGFVKIDLDKTILSNLAGGTTKKTKSL